MTGNPLKRIRLPVTGWLLAIGLVLAACGGSGGGGDKTAGIGGTGIVYGQTTGFGSIYVNGRRYKTDSSRFVVDGDSSASQTDLELGMVVKVSAKTLDGALIGEALEVVYDDEVEGPIANTPVLAGTQKTFTVFGQTVTIDETATLFRNIDFAGIAQNDVVEISGFRVSDNEIRATYVAWKGTYPATTGAEIRGLTSNYSPGVPETFDVRGVTVTTSGTTVVDVPGGLGDGLYVEVKGNLNPADPTEMTATRVELDYRGFGDDVDDVSLQGIIANYVSDSNFEINGQQVDAGGAQFSPAGAALGNGVEVEVEGPIVGGVLIADELELREGEVELRAVVDSITPASSSFDVAYNTILGLSTVTVQVDTQTTFEDELVGGVANLSLDQLAPGDYVKIEGREGSGKVVADVVKRDILDDRKLQGAVDTFVYGNWIEILGIRIGVDGGTVYNEGSSNAAQFFDELTLNPNAVVEIKDKQPDGYADEVEFDD